MKLDIEQDGRKAEGKEEKRFERNRGRSDRPPLLEGRLLLVQLMLPRLASPYSSQTDFDGHAGRSTIDFQDDAAVRALTAALLERDFRLRIELPSDRLCPTVPSRLEYVLFVLRLALLTSDEPPPASLNGLDIGTGASAIYPLLAVRTAESASFSSTSPFPPLKMLTTDINDHSLHFARRNIATNDLAGAIQLFKVDAEGAIFPEEVVSSVEQIDFTMCNPPFYNSDEEIAASLAKKEHEPFAKCTGADNEMVTPGGEVAFISRMVEESLILGTHKIRWFTSLLGKYSSIGPLVDLLKSKKASSASFSLFLLSLTRAQQILNYHVHALPPHGYTTRWVLSWSLQDKRFPLESVTDLDTPARPSSTSTTSGPSFPLARFLSAATLPAICFTPSLPSSPSRDPLEHVRETLDEILRELVGEPVGSSQRALQRTAKRPGVERDGRGGSMATGLEWHWTGAAAKDGAEENEGEEEEREVWVKAWRNIWSRKVRRATSQTSTSATTAAGDDPAPTRPFLELRISLVVSSPSPASSSHSASADPTASQAQAQAKLTLTWLRGLDADCPALTGFWGYLTRKVGERVKALNDGTKREREREREGEERGKTKRRRTGPEANEQAG
ncbi:hypothetical protein JCM10296v2_006994 [Rhodotorula toruloides]